MSQNNISPIANTKTNSPKLHFTPCRRLGLKRRSPLTLSNHPITIDSPNTPKTIINTKSIENLDENTPKKKYSKSICFKKIIYENKKLEETDSNKIYTRKDLEELKLNIEEVEAKILNLKSNRHIIKHEVNDLKELTFLWKKGCQEALYCLLNLTKSQGYTMTMGKLLEALKIPSELVDYEVESEDFI